MTPTASTGSRSTTLDEAVSTIRSGDTVAIGGAYFYRHPMALVRAIVRAGIKDLTLVVSLSSIESDLLIAAGAVKKVIFGFVSFDVLGLAPNFRKALETGVVEPIEYGDLPLMRSLEASTRELPYMIARSLTGTNLLEHHPARAFTSESGETLLQLPPIRPDVFLVHAQWSDTLGNLLIEGESYDIEMAKASKRIIASVERVVGHHELARMGKSTIPNYTVDALVELPFGAHPCSCYPFYVHDLWHLMDYHDAGAKGGPGPKPYLEKYVYGPKDHEEYLEAVGGIRKLLKLQRLATRGIAAVRN